MDQVLIQGGVLTEVDFFHRPSRTLILADLIENFELKRIRSWLVRWLVRLGGAVDPDGKAPVDLRLSFLGRRVECRGGERNDSEGEEIAAHGSFDESAGRFVR